MKLSELPPSPPKILLFGPFGRGKTALLLTLGKHLQVYDFDAGLRTGQTLRDQFFDARQQVDVQRCVEEPSSSPSAFAKACAHLKKVESQCQAGTYAYKVLGIDSLTRLCDSAIRYILHREKPSAPTARPPTQPEWGIAFIEIEAFVLKLFTLPIPVIMIAHELQTKVNNALRMEIGIPGQKMPYRIPGYFDEVWYMKIEFVDNLTRYVIQTRGSESILSRTRSNVPDTLDVNRGLVDIFEKELGYKL